MFCFPVVQCKKFVVTLWMRRWVFKNLGRRPHGETSCKLFGTPHEPVCQTKWKAAGCHSSCLVKISVYFGLLTHHPHFTELSHKNHWGKVRVPICTCSMLSCLLHSAAEALQRALLQIFASQGEVVLLVCAGFIPLEKYGFKGTGHHFIYCLPHSYTNGPAKVFLDNCGLHILMYKDITQHLKTPFNFNRSA